MSTHVYTIRDNVASRIGPLVCFSNDEEAMRAVKHNIATGGDSIMSRSPSDFVVLRVADIDSDSGVVSSYEPVFVCAVETLLDVSK